MATITVQNLQKRVRIKVRSLEELAVKALGSCLELSAPQKSGLIGLPEVSVAIVSDRRMAALHEKFMNQAGPTDVLTFDHGEIVISADTASRNAQVFRNPVARELLLYVVHGLLHLHGFDDGTPADRRKMEKAQDQIVREIT